MKKSCRGPPSTPTSPQFARSQFSPKRVAERNSLAFNIYGAEEEEEECSGERVASNSTSRGGANRHVLYYIIGGVTLRATEPCQDLVFFFAFFFLFFSLFYLFIFSFFINYWGDRDRFSQNRCSE